MHLFFLVREVLRLQLPARWLADLAQRSHPQFHCRALDILPNQFATDLFMR